MIYLDRNERKSVVKEILLEDINLLKEVVEEIMLEKQTMISVEQKKRQQKLEKLINADFDKYDEVFKALA